jgi:hypothetical protein
VAKPRELRRGDTTTADNDASDEGQQSDVESNLCEGGRVSGSNRAHTTINNSTSSSSNNNNKKHNSSGNGAQNVNTSAVASNQNNKNNNKPSSV